MHYTQFIARKGQSLEDHLLGVSHKAKKFAAKIDLAEHGELIGLLHDLGKYSQEFQNYLNTILGQDDPDDDTDNTADEFKQALAKKGKIDHSTAGAQWIWQNLKNFGNKNEGKLCAQLLAICIASHHSGLIDCLKPDGTNTFANRMQKEDFKTHFPEVCANANSEILVKAKQLATTDLIKNLLKKIKHIYKDINEETIKAFYLGFLTRFLFSCLIDADRIDSASVGNPAYLKNLTKETDWQIAIARFEKNLAALKSNYEIDKSRREISDSCYQKAQAEQGIYTLTVPTGGGKTLASLRFALQHAQKHKLDRIIYIIPYTSIIEQNAQAIRDIIEHEGDEFPWVLEHHSNLEPEKQTWHSKLTAENWDAPIILTTMVQFLEALFSGGTRGVRRLHQLANSVLIFDEIQTLPIKCVHLFCNALNFLVNHAKTTAVLCTATQPLLGEVDPTKGRLTILPNRELAPSTDALFKQLQRVTIHNHCKPGGWTKTAIVALLLNEFRQKGNCLIIVNTKTWARELYEACKEELPQAVLFHLSTHQYPAHRKHLFKQIRQRLANNLPVLCISTQLIEAGVDIDFASVIRFLAGLDSILQAAGRCNRNGNLKNAAGEPIKGTVHIINPTIEAIDSLIDIKVGRDQTERVLNDFPAEELTSLAAMNNYFLYYFFKRAEAMEYPLDDKKLGKNTLLNFLSANYGNRGLDSSTDKLPLLQQSFMTAGEAFKALEVPHHSVIIAHQGGKEIVAELCQVAKNFDSGKYYQLLKQAQQYTVNVFSNVWQKLQQQQAVYEIQQEGIYFLDEQYYSEEFGLATEPVAQMDFNMV